MASTTRGRQWGRCAPKLLVALMIAITLMRGCSGDTPVPVVVSTVYRSVPDVTDGAADGAGNFLLLTSSGAVYRGLPNGATVQLVATTPFTGSLGRAYGIACDAAANVAYITGSSDNHIYKLALRTTNMSIFAGNGTLGTADGVGTDAQFNYPYGIVHYAPTGLLYVADYFGATIRKIVVATANVTTVATGATNCRYLCITVNGTFLYITYGSTNNTIVRVSASGVTNVTTTTTCAGSSTQRYTDGVETDTQFSTPQGIALNSDESALIIADQGNSRIRRLELSLYNVTSIAGNGTRGGADGPGPSATFSGLHGARWYCNQSSMLCGVLVADNGNKAVRFVAIEYYTVTAVMSLSAPSSGTASATAGLMSSSHSGTASATTSFCATESQLKESRTTQLSSPTRVVTETLETPLRSESTSVTWQRSASATRRASATVTWSRTSTQATLATSSLSSIATVTHFRIHPSDTRNVSHSLTATYRRSSTKTETDTFMRCSTQLWLHATPPSVLDLEACMNVSGANASCVPAVQMNELSQTEWVMTVPPLSSISEVAVLMVKFSFLTTTLSGNEISPSLSSWNFVEGGGFSESRGQRFSSM